MRFADLRSVSVDPVNGSDVLCQLDPDHPCATMRAAVRMVPKPQSLGMVTRQGLDVQSPFRSRLTILAPVVTSPIQIQEPVYIVGAISPSGGTSYRRVLEREQLREVLRTRHVQRPIAAASVAPPNPNMTELHHLRAYVEALSAQSSVSTGRGHGLSPEPSTMVYHLVRPRAKLDEWTAVSYASVSTGDGAVADVLEQLRVPTLYMSTANWTANSSTLSGSQIDPAYTRARNIPEVRCVGGSKGVPCLSFEAETGTSRTGSMVVHVLIDGQQHDGACIHVGERLDLSIHVRNGVRWDWIAQALDPYPQTEITW